MVSADGKPMPVFHSCCPCIPFTTSVSKMNVCKSLCANYMFIVARDVDTLCGQVTVSPR